MGIYSPQTASLSTFTTTVKTVLSNPTSFPMTLLALIPDFLSSKHDISDLLSDITQELFINAEFDSKTTHLVSSDLTCPSFNISPGQSPFGKVEIMELRNVHLPLAPHSKLSDLPTHESEKSRKNSISARLALMYYRYEVTFGIYILQPKEKIIMNAIVLGLLAIMGYLVYLMLPMALISGVLAGVDAVLKLGIGKIGVLGSEFGVAGIAGGRNFSVIEGRVTELTVWDGVMGHRIEL